MTAAMPSSPSSPPRVPSSAHCCPARLVPDYWARVYWPAALAVCVAALALLPYRYTGYVLGGGSGVLGVPELIALACRRNYDTLSDWFWRVLHVTQTQQIEQWSAVHFLALGLYLSVASDAVMWMYHLGILATGAAATLAVWLTRHLFFRWWR